LREGLQSGEGREAGDRIATFFDIRRGKARGRGTGGGGGGGGEQAERGGKGGRMIAGEWQTE